MGKTEVSQVPGEPLCTRALLLDSGGFLGSHHTEPTNVAFRLTDTVGHHKTGLSKLDHTAHVRAVYALPRGSPHTVQDSLLACWLGISETGLHPLGSTSEFQEAMFVSFPFRPGLAWRTDNGPLRKEENRR